MYTYVANQNAIQLIRNFYQTLRNGPYSNGEAVKSSVSPKSHVRKLEGCANRKLIFYAMRPELWWNDL